MLILRLSFILQSNGEFRIALSLLRYVLLEKWKRSNTYDVRSLGPNRIRVHFEEYLFALDKIGTIRTVFAVIFKEMIFYEIFSFTYWCLIFLRDRQSRWNIILLFSISHLQMNCNESWMFYLVNFNIFLIFAVRTCKRDKL